MVNLGPLLPRGLVVGRHTYGPVDYYATFPMYTEGARTTVGAFCSISPECRILGGGEHRIDRASTFPLNSRLFDPAGRTGPDSVATAPTVIGNDVYIGVGAIVLAGVTIGDGAVVGAGAVVTNSVPPYAIVAGNPARVVRHRFDAETRARLLALAWWEWDDSEIRAAQPWFMADIASFLDEMEQAHAR
jgi:acetyltransferase-like isoleucine patch superfamily enzyme